MENIINQIIKIEDKAQKIMSEAEKLEKSLDSDINDKINNIRSDIETRVTNKYETIKKTEAMYADRKIEEIKKQYESASLRLDKSYEQNKDKWIEEIYNSVIGNK